VRAGEAQGSRDGSRCMVGFATVLRQSKRPFSAQRHPTNDPCYALQTKRARRFFKRFSSRRSCSHKRITRHRFFRSDRVTERSRTTFRSILACQYARLSAGIRQCFGHPCQKQPSTNIATRNSGNTKSGLPGIRGCRRHPRSPACLNITRSRNSVDLFPTDRTRDMIRERSILVNVSAIVVEEG
jgi:hypothetical protein